MHRSCESSCGAFISIYIKEGIITVYVISDIHGYPADKIKALFQSVNFGADDYCYCLGDVIDRGSDGIENLLWIMQQPNIKFILGNHESMLLSCEFLFNTVTNETVEQLDNRKMMLYMNWAFNGCEPTLAGLKALSYEERADIIDYLKEAPVYDSVTVSGKDFIFTHGGISNFSANKPLRAYSADELLWNRPQLSDRYFDDMTVVFGHTPTCYLDEAVQGKVLFTDTWIDIDCGAARGFAPALLRLDDMKAFYAQSIG